ncbi:response regulator [Brunnivagina elsteri]|uniref:Circadian input-output histidine kinase CikA n=1 Tax=Brunnivagina elsteri CCALA 953 TaxID=987040 RepID=A0A2A2TLM6_9CYAN|nr:response regulator [Calothrix elsteri]PAX58407.1 two-component system sensor histidine kinase/response regulator [Calothrix elsteri CCALA 953]
MLNRLKIGTKIGASFALSLAILTAIGLISYCSINELITSSSKEKHTYQVLSHLQSLTLEIRNAENGARGYIITEKNYYLKPYEIATKESERLLQELRNKTSDNLNQQNRLKLLEPLIEQRLERLKNGINLRKNQGFDAAQQFILTNQGTKIVEEIAQITRQMEAEENQLLLQLSNNVKAAVRLTLSTIVYGILLSFILLAVIGYILTRNISKPLSRFSQIASALGKGDLSVSLPTSDRKDEIGLLTRTFNQMIANLRDTIEKNDRQNWLQSNLAEFSQRLQGSRDLETVTRLIISYLTPLVGASQGAFFVINVRGDEPVLKLVSGYAYKGHKNLANEFKLGEGLVGQCALEKQRILLTQVPSDYIRISSGLGEATPLNILVLPILFEEQVTGIIELASFQIFQEVHLDFLELVTETIGIVLNMIFSDIRTQEFLEESQQLTEELQQSNQILEDQAKALQNSEVLLKNQQEELKHSNEELQKLNEKLEEKAELLEQQKQEIELARQDLEEKAKQLAVSSKYKSEFLANMSHELRTPLNSLLILARLLADNGGGNLTEKQVEYSRTIYAAGTDLLELINEILDLAKIESGTLSLDIEQVTLTDLQMSLERNFQQIAEGKGLKFKIELDTQLPKSITTDIKRLQQILKNLLANAFKFTEQGNVTLKIGVAPENMINFAVSDTGIGIPTDKHKVIFEAFQQADGSTSRKYGGTGLGLSISRELAQLLGGRIELTSKLNQGSIFTLVLPQLLVQTEAVEIIRQGKVSPIIESPLILYQSEIPDDRDIIQLEDRILLIIEDDDKFARILLEMAREQGFKAIVALRGKQGLALAKKFQPDAITLDVNMPGMDGWTVLDILKRDPETRHIPVHIMSIDDREQRGLNFGAIAYLQKPISKEVLTEKLTEIKGFVERKVKNLLVIEDDLMQANSIIELIGNGDVQSTSVGTGAEALSFLQANQVDCIVLDLGLPDINGFELIEQIKQQPSLIKIPIIVYTGKELSQKEETKLRRLTETIIIKNVRSPERLFDETALFLHRVQANLPQVKQKILESLCTFDPVLADKKILIVDDDVRNIFALTSLLEGYEMQVFFAENGRDGVEVLQANPDINIVLMDIMMPEMDGYETTRNLRKQTQFKTLPIIALTAKAMQGDKEKCIEVGASDYITKPVDTEQLISLLRVWLY